MTSTPELLASGDGTSIALWRWGSGPPLVALHGVTIDHTCWDGMRPALESRRALVAIDRRGHGASDDGPEPHSLHQEVEDLLAVLEAFEAPVDVLGHSYGGLVALEAALVSRCIGRLVLYEPSIDDEPDFPGIVERVGRMVSAGRDEDAAVTLLVERSGVPPESIKAVRELPLWSTVLRGVKVLPREGAAIVGYGFQAERFAALSNPVLVLFGDQSPPWRRQAMEALDAALPNSRLRALAGQGHLATHTAPELLAAEILNFLDADGYQATPD
jgi:pimeloyl-ACP methyl ester carboxylesterase